MKEKIRNPNLSKTKIFCVGLLFLFVGSAVFSSTAGSRFSGPSSASRLFSSADGLSLPGVNTTSSGYAIHAYNGGSIESQQATTDWDGNSMSIQVEGFVFNPLYDADPNYDYYIFSTYVTASSNYANNWWVDSAGLSDPNGPTLGLSAFIVTPNASIISSQLSPSGQVLTYASEPVTYSVSQTLSGSVCVYGVVCASGSYSSTVSSTFYPVESDTSSDIQSQNEVTWTSAANTYENPQVSSYSYAFVFGLKVPENQTPNINLYLTGNFYQPYSYPCGTFNWDTCYSTYQDNSWLSLSGTFSPPPVTTIKSNPSGAGIVQVDGTPVTTPALFVWNVGNTHTIAAAPSATGTFGERYVFSSWSDGGAQSHSIAASATPETITAEFQEQYKLSIGSSPGGTTDPPTGTYWYDSNQTAVIKAHPQMGYVLEDWVLDGFDRGNASQISVPINQTHSLVAYFIQKPALPSITISAGNGGTVTIQSSSIDNDTPQLIPSGGQETYSVVPGSVVTMSEQLNQGYSFLQWSGSQSSLSPQFSVTVQGAMQENANFAQITTTTSSSSSSGSPASSTTSSIPTSSTQSTTTTQTSMSLSESSSTTSASGNGTGLSPTVIISGLTSAIVAVGAVVAGFFKRRL